MKQSLQNNNPTKIVDPRLKQIADKAITSNLFPTFSMNPEGKNKNAVEIVEEKQTDQHQTYIVAYLVAKYINNTNTGNSIIIQPTRFY